MPSRTLQLKCSTSCFRNYVLLAAEYLYGQAKKHYEKAFRDAEKAQDAHKRAEQDVNLSKADVEKVNSDISEFIELLNSFFKNIEMPLTEDGYEKLLLTDTLSRSFRDLFSNTSRLYLIYFYIWSMLNA